MSQRYLRIGSAEEAILLELRRSGGPVPRQLLVRVVQRAAASVRRSPQQADPIAGEERTLKNAESTLSRALRSLERKGLVVRTFSTGTRQTLVSLADAHDVVAWEQEARGEEAFADRCDAVATELTNLARRARRRASRLRVDRTTTSTARERAGDRGHWTHLMSPRLK